MPPSLGAGFELFGARVIGGADAPTLTAESYPRLPAATSVTVGVIDTGVVLDRRGRPHPWFGRDHLSYCRYDDEDVLSYGAGDHAPADGHGTFVAGVVLREAPSARVRTWGVLAKERVPTRESKLTGDDDVAVAAALGALALNRDVRVVNLSFGGGVWLEHEEPKVLRRALTEFCARRPDVAIVAAAGNQGGEATVWPAGFCTQLPHVISVGAVDETSPIPEGSTPAPAAFSNTGEWLCAFASGVDVLGPQPRPDKHDGWARWSGTSFAAAIVSGRIAQVAIEQGCSGVAAWDRVSAASVSLGSGRSKWIRSVNTPPFLPATD
jgi:subtilisin family serine protease